MSTLTPPEGVNLGRWYSNIYGESPSRKGFDIGPLGHCDGILNTPHEKYVELLTQCPEMASALVDIFKWGQQFGCINGNGTAKNPVFAQIYPILQKAGFTLKD